jgi:hypothetical protein
MKYAVIETLDNEVHQVKLMEEHSAAMSLAIQLAKENDVDPDNDEGEFNACMEEDGTYENDNGWRVTIYAV